MNGPDWVKQAGKEYLARIEAEKPLFLGELQVTDDELTELFRRIRQCASIDRCDEMRASLAVAAVHAAVHASEDENSYVTVFFRYLGEEEDATQWNEEYGPVILRFLVDHFEEVERAGAFRFVRPILNHAGISYRVLPAFAKFISKLRDEAGPGYTRLDYARILKGVSSKFARNFLQVGPGYDFTREAMQTWERIERGIISIQDCNELPGYRRGFWPDLLECLNEQGSHIKGEGWLPPPTEHLDCDNRRLVLKFPEIGVVKRVYTLNGQTVQFSIEPLSHARTLNGTIVQRSGAVYNWQLQPWRPGDGDWALFRKSDGAMVAAPQPGDHSTVAPGDYYLLAADGTSVPDDLIQEEGPYLDWNDRSGVVSLYRIWSVHLRPGKEWNDLDLQTSGSSVPTLDFERGKGAFLSAGVNVFQGFLPMIRVGNWSSEAAQRYAVLIDFGSGPRNIGERVRDGSIKVDSPVPCRGKVWIEPKGRIRHSIASLPSVEFAVLTSQFRWQKPEQMFSNSDQIPIRFESNQQFEVIWDSPVVVVDRTSWRVKPPSRVAEGTLRLGHIEIPFSFRLPRCGVSMPRQPQGPFTLWVERVDEYDSLLIEALPGREGHLLLKDEREAWTLWSVGQIPESGVRRCLIVEFRDSLLSSNLHAARMGVSVTGGQPVWLDSFVASAKRIREVLPTAAEDCEVFELPVLGTVLREIRAAFDRTVDSLKVPVEALASPIGQYIADCLISTAVVDGTTIECAARIESYASADLTKVLRWFEQRYQKDGLAQVPSAAEVTFPGLSLIPIKRLRERLQQRIDQEQLWADIAGTVCSWRKEVLSSNSPLMSAIANRPGGRELTQAARLYARAMSTKNQKQFITVIRELRLLSQSDCDDLVGVITSVVHQLALYNSSRREDAATFSIPQMPSVFRRLAAQMRDLAAFCSGGHIAGNWPDGVGLGDISPAEGDRELESILLRNSTEEA
jgi:hypothetical protein